MRECCPFTPLVLQTPVQSVQSVQLLDESTAIYCAQRSKHKEIDYRRPTPSLKSNYEDIDPQNTTGEHREINTRSGFFNRMRGMWCAYPTAQLFQLVECRSVVYCTNHNNSAPAGGWGSGWGWLRRVAPRVLIRHLIK